VRWWDFVCVSTRGGSQFPSVLLHPPTLASESIASYGEMSRRSGFAAEADNHSDISPRLESTSCGRPGTGWRKTSLHAYPDSACPIVPIVCNTRGATKTGIVSDLLIWRDHLRRSCWDGGCRRGRRLATSGPTSAASTPRCASTARATAV